jgi:hypothetical protein
MRDEATRNPRHLPVAIRDSRPDGPLPISRTGRSALRFAYPRPEQATDTLADQRAHELADVVERRRIRRAAPYVENRKHPIGH